MLNLSASDSVRDIRRIGEDTVHSYMLVILRADKELHYSSKGLYHDAAATCSLVRMHERSHDGIIQEPSQRGCIKWTTLVLGSHFHSVSVQTVV